MRDRRAWVLWAVLALSAAWAPSAGLAGDTWSRPEPRTVRQQADRVLADPRFSRRMGLAEWVRQQFQRRPQTRPQPYSGGGGGGGGPAGGWDIGPGLAEFLRFLAIGICVAAVAVALYFLLAVIVRGLAGRSRRRHRSRADADGQGQPARAADEPPVSEELAELFAAARALAEAGEILQAVGLLMRGGLRWLDGRRLVRYEQSKTTGQYVREFPSRMGEARRSFRQFALGCDIVLYSGTHERFDDFEEVAKRLKKVRDDVRSQETAQ